MWETSDRNLHQKLFLIICCLIYLLLLKNQGRVLDWNSSSLADDNFPKIITNSGLSILNVTWVTVV